MPQNLLRNELSHFLRIFLDELLVRKELADNFCFYNPFYDSKRKFDVKTYIKNVLPNL
jgi:hypothetical protein